MADISLDVAQARFDSGEDWIRCEVVQGDEVRITASVFEIQFDNVFTFVFDGTDNEFSDAIGEHMSNLLLRFWMESGVDLSLV